MKLGKYKLLALIDVINSKIISLPSGSKFDLDRERDLDNIYSEVELNNQLLKLQDNEKVIKVEWPRPPEYREDFDHELYHLSVDLDAYKAYVDKLYREEFPTLYLRGIQESVLNKATQKNDVVYEIIYNLANEVILNEVVLLARLNLNSNNDLILQYLIKNPKRKITKEELEQNLELTNIDLHKFVENLHFSGDIKKVFFGKVSKSTIQLNNPVTRTDLNNLGIPRLLISINSKSQRN
jgi:hypothetical protein